MDINEFISKMAEQHSHLLKVIELQNNSIQAIHQRLNALSMSQSIIFSLMLESDKGERERIAEHLRNMLKNSSVNDNPYLLKHLEECLELCQTPVSKPKAGAPSSDKATPAWFQGIVDGGLSQSQDK